MPLPSTPIRMAVAAVMLVSGSAALASAPQPGARPLPDASWRLVGPFRAGWATAVSGIEGDPTTFYFGGAGGGVWKTTDAGHTWRGLMQNERASAIGALAVAPSDPRVLYAGTGQPDARYDIMAGEGLYRSADGGETWRRVGLERSRHIGAILVHPRDPDRVLVAVLGHVFGSDPQRGVFLTRDGGRSWKPVLVTPDSVGAVDLAWDPLKPEVVFATTWQLRFHPWLDYFMPQGGRGSGVWRSDDGGEHWRRLAGGLPSGRVGRIGVAVARGSGGRTVYACVQAYSPPAAMGTPRGTPGAAGGGAPMSAEKSGLYRSDDAGESWQLVNPDGSLGSSYFGHVIVAPDDPERVYVMGRSIRVSRDGGRHFQVLRGSPGGDDYHALWIDPSEPKRMIAGSDQGAGVTTNDGGSWSSWYNQPTGQFYHLAADERFPYHIYSGQQDNGTIEIASRGAYGVIEERDWHPVGGDERDYMVPKPGDPRTVFGSGLGGTISRFDEETRQSADVSAWPLSSYGADPRTVRYHYTWITPLEISPLPPHAMYLGAQVLFRSLDDGQTWDTVSPDLSGKSAGGAFQGESPTLEQARAAGFGVVFSIAPSPRDTASIWVGTDDGLVKRTRDGGAHWADVTPPGTPAWGIVSSLSLSPLDESTAYVAIDTHRLDRFAPIAFRTHDGGRTWQPIARGLPQDEFVAVVRCDRKQKGLLYAGTNRSIYVSFDDGEHWQPLAPGFPTTWVRDLLPHHDDLIAATQGRGIWVLDDVSPLRAIAAGLGKEPVALVAPAAAVRLRTSENHDTPPPPETPLGQNPPTGAVFDYWLAAPARGVTLTISDASGAPVRSFRSDDPPESLQTDVYYDKAWLKPPARLERGAGMHRFVWDLRYPRPAARSFRSSIAAVLGGGTPAQPLGPFVLPGRYTVKLSVDGTTKSRTLEVKLDPRIDVPAQGLAEQLRLSQAIDSALVRAWSAHDAIQLAQKEGAESLSPALRDSLASLGTRGGTSLAGAANSLTDIAIGVQSADTAPAQGLREGYREVAILVDGLIARWQRLEPMLREASAARPNRP